MLLTDGYGGVGGVAKFNRDFLQALDACQIVERVQAVPRLVPRSIDGRIPESVVYDRKASKSRSAFLLRAAWHAWCSESVTLVICGHLHLLSVAWLVARCRRARLALVIHGMEAWTPSRKFLANWLVHKVDAVIAVSDYSAKEFERWSEVPAERFFVLPNCVDLNVFQPQPRDRVLMKRYGLETNRVILTVGRLASQERYKGFDVMIELMPRLLRYFPDLKYLIVGAGDDRSRLEAKAATHGVTDSVVFAGEIPESEKVAHYNLADVFVLPSTGEGFGIVLIEAAAAGVPAIGSRIGGSREALREGLLGRLIDPGKPDELLEAVRAALSDPSRGKRPDGIDWFGAERFRERVADWCLGQSADAVTKRRIGA
jgi:phosphatidyl-myo-inositol dimannoside synthase